MWCVFVYVCLCLCVCVCVCVCECVCVCVCIKHILEYVSGQPWPVSEIGIVEPLAKFMNEYGLV